RRGRGGIFLGFLEEVLEQGGDLVGWLGADAQPVLDAVRLQLDALRLVLHHRVVGSEFLDQPAVARLATVDRHDPEKWTVLPSQHLHANTTHICLQIRNLLVPRLCLGPHRREALPRRQTASLPKRARQSLDRCVPRRSLGTRLTRCLPPPLLPLLLPLFR